MKISELPKHLRELAEANRIVKDEDDLYLAFSWSFSKEGEAFWFKVYNGNFDL